MVAKPRQAVNVGSSANDDTGDGLRQSFTKLNENSVELFSKFSELISYHTPTAMAAGTINGMTIDSGQALVATGAGAAGATGIADGYFENTAGDHVYFQVNNGQPVRRVVYHYRGTYAVMAIGNSGTFADMVHVEFPSGGAPTITYWDDPLVGQVPVKPIAIANCPDLNDGETHELAVEVYGDFVAVFADGEPLAIAYDPIFPSIVGDWYYTQLSTGSIHRNYGWEAYSGPVTELIEKRAGVSSGIVTSDVLYVGDRDHANFDPGGQIYVYLNDGEPGLTVEGNNGGEYIMKALSFAGFGSGIKLINGFDHELRLRCNHAATATLDFQGTTYISIANAGKLSFPNKLSDSTVADATDATDVITRLNELLAILRTVGVITT